MNSLVVLLSVMALSAASPYDLLHGPEVISYAAPAVAVGPTAVSHQSRVDIKSSPAVVSETITPVARADIAEPAAVVAAPAVYAAPVAYSAPVAYAAPAAFPAPVAVAPTAVSSQSRVDIKSSPAVIDTVATAPWLNNIAAAPIVYTAPFGSVYGPSAVAAVAPTLFRSAAIAPVSVAPAAAAPVAAAALPVAPAETPEVAAARAAHLEAKAKAEAEAHSIHKRSAQFIATPLVSSHAAPVVSTYSASPVIYSAPVARVHSYGVPAPYFARVL